MSQTRLQKGIPVLVAFAFLVGVGLTSTFFTVRGRAEIAPVATESAEKTEEPAGVVKLDPLGEKTSEIRTQPVRYRSIQTALTVPGVVEVADNRVARVTPPTAGKVVRILVRVGASVRAGQPLAILDSYEVAQARAAVRQAAAQIAQMEAALRTEQAESEQARTREKNARAALNTQRELAQAGAFAQAPLQAARAALADAQSELLTAQTEQQSHDIAFQRAERLFKEGITSKSELEAASLERQQDVTAVMQAQARVENARQTLTREQEVGQKGLLNRQAVQAGEAERRTAESEVAHLQRQVEAARVALTGARQTLAGVRANLAALIGTGRDGGSGGLLTLVAPMDGIVSQVQSTVGEAVERSGTLFVLENLSAVVVAARVPEAEVAGVRVGQNVAVTVAAYPERQFSGMVQTLANRVDEKTRTLTARCLVTNTKGLLRPAMFAEARIWTATDRRALAIPEVSLTTESAGKPFVFIRGTDGYEKRDVRIGAKHGDWRVVLEGLKEGEAVVTDGAFVLRSEARKSELKEEE